MLLKKKDLMMHLIIIGFLRLKISNSLKMPDNLKDKILTYLIIFMNFMKILKSIMPIKKFINMLKNHLLPIMDSGIY